MSGQWQTIASFRRDPDSVRGKNLEPETIRRVIGLCRPYRRQLIGFLVTVVLAAIAGAIPPLILRSLLDSAVPDENRTLVAVLAFTAVALAIASAAIERLFLKLAQQAHETGGALGRESGQTATLPPFHDKPAACPTEYARRAGELIAGSARSLHRLGK